jgi:hypothetical protein
MIRAALGLAALLAGPALAGGGPILGGEHVGFSRIVLEIDPATEWSLATAPGRATVAFPGSSLAFATAGTFDKLPKTRIRAVRPVQDAAGTRVEVDISCDCLVSALAVGTRYLALDVADPGVLPSGVEPGAQRALSQAPSAVEAASETPDMRAARESEAVASAEAALIAQIERAASQGLIQLSENAPEEPASPAEPAPAEPAPAVAPPPAPPARPDPDPGAVAPTALLDHDQIEAITVYDRDSRHAQMADAPPPAPACLPDDRLDVGGWSNGLPLVDQLARLRRQLVGEFDQPNPIGVGDLARLYIRFGFGAEAEMLLADFPAELDDRPLLADLARAVEGRQASPDGPLAYPGPCPGRHGLWLALGGVAPVFHNPDSFASVQAAFAELPTDLRALLGPGLVDRLLDAGRPAEARVIHDTTVRPSLAPSPELELAAARLVAAEGHPTEATQALMALVERGAPNAVTALTYAARLALDNGLPIPDRVITDLGAAALQFRGSDREAELRRLLAEALAARAELPAAIEEIRKARADLPAGDFDALAVTLLAAADPAAVGPSAYAETALASADLIAPGPGNDAARRAIAARLVELGLPAAALDVIAPTLARDDAAARLVAARAHLRLGHGAQARLTLGALEGAEASELRARAFALNGNFTDAVTTLAAKGLEAEASPYAWPSGDWPRARAAADDPARVAMASYMEAVTGAAPLPAPAADPAALPPDQAFQQPVPSLANPSLDAARRLLATGAQLEGFIEGLLAEAP